MPDLEGVDVSHHEGVIDWEQVSDEGIAFAIVKATEGKSFEDPKVERNLTKCREVGIVPGMYHFYRHDVDPEAQAAHFIDKLSLLRPGDLVPAIDVEGPDDGGGAFSYPRSEVVRRVGEVVRAVQDAVGRAPMIYTYPAAWKELTNNSTAFAGQCPLWIASYKVEAPKLVGGWTEHTVWQWTDVGKVKGIGGGVDRDRFNGGLDQLKAFCVGALQVGGRAVLNQDGRVRATPGLDGAEIAVLPGGTRVAIIDGPVSADGREWWKIDNGAGTVGWTSGRLLAPA